MGRLFGEYGAALWSGTSLSLQLAAIGFVGAMIIGTLLAMCRVSPIPPLRAFAALYVEFLRNVPMVTLMILVVYGLPYVGVNLGQFWSVTAAIITVGAAFACETIRSGINAVSAGQVEAARAIGLTFWGISRELVIPQALRTVIGPLVTLFIGILLSTSLAAVVGMRELTATAGYINNRAALGLLTFGVVAVIYMAISLAAAAIGAALERRYRVLR